MFQTTVILKKARNRASWINKRFVQLDDEIEQHEMILNDSSNTSNADLLQEAMTKLTQLEDEYLNLINELDQLVLD